MFWFGKYIEFVYSVCVGESVSIVSITFLGEPQYLAGAGVQQARVLEITVSQYSCFVFFCHLPVLTQILFERLKNGSAIHANWKDRKIIYPSPLHLH